MDDEVDQENKPYIWSEEFTVSTDEQQAVSKINPWSIKYIH